MLTTLNDGDVKATPGRDAAPVMHAVAEKLHDRGIKIRWPKYRDSRRLAIVTARRARSEITAEDCGYVTWDYWPCTGPDTEPADLAGMVLDVLGVRVTTLVPAA